MSKASLGKPGKCSQKSYSTVFNRDMVRNMFAEELEPRMESWLFQLSTVWSWESDNLPQTSVSSPTKSFIHYLYLSLYFIHLLATF
jgi:hypothetical protein